MAYSIQKLSGYSPSVGNSYFIDANVWIYNIDASTKPDHKAYIDFFNNLIAEIDDFDDKKSKLQEKGKLKPGQFDDSQRPIIILTPLLISEMFNVLIKGHFDVWKKITGNSKAIFKNDFRKSHNTYYINAVQYLRQELFSYEKYFKIIDDSDKVIGVKALFDGWNYDMDFNDQCYYFTCLENKYILITNDGDFLLPEVEIFTELPFLLTMATKV